jgi:hypothetical protein
MAGGNETFKVLMPDISSKMVQDLQYAIEDAGFCQYLPIVK